MPTTVTPISKIVLSSSPISVVFDNIPSTYSDLMILSSTRSTRTGTSWVGNFITMNTSENWTEYSAVGIQAAGTSLATFVPVFTNYYGVLVNNAPTDGHTANSFTNTEIYIPNYNGTALKSFSAVSVGGINASDSIINVTSGTWNSTSSINKITIWCNGNIGGHAYSSGSSFYLYGINKF